MTDTATEHVWIELVGLNEMFEFGAGRSVVRELTSQEARALLNDIGFRADEYGGVLFADGAAVICAGYDHEHSNCDTCGFSQDAYVNYYGVETTGLA
jgi:hypothetical protein